VNISRNTEQYLAPALRGATAETQRARRQALRRRRDRLLTVLAAGGSLTLIIAAAVL
jgi:hypothetical protein